MVNLRYHMVSIVAVFLALGVGVVIGASVVDPVTVEVIQENLQRVQDSIEVTRSENAELAEAVARGDEFAEEARDILVAGRLVGVPVMIIAAPGADRQALEEIDAALVAAGATRAGSLRFSSGMALATDEEVRRLAAAMGVPPGNAATVRQLSVNRLAFALAGGPDSQGGAGGELISALVAADLASYDPATPVREADGGEAPAPIDLDSWPVPGLLFVVVSGPETTMADADLAEPLVRALARDPAVTPRVVAVATALSGDDGDASPTATTEPPASEPPASEPPASEPPASEPRASEPRVGRELDADTDGLVLSLRGDGSLDARVSTVDNGARPEGQAAIVLALSQLPEGRTGHYGTGPRTDRVLPAALP